MAALATLVIVGIGAALAVRAFPNKGARSPEEAMERFSQAALSQDWLDLAFMIEPTERRVFLDRYEEIQDELVRLEVADKSQVDLKNLGDVADLKVSDLVTSVEPVNSDIYRGWIDSAHVAGSYDLSKNPELAALLGIAESDTIDQEINTRDQQFPVAIVERDGKWYVSLWYTVAENIRVQTDAPPPDPSGRLTPIGADSPSEAATQLVESMVRLDFPTVIAMMDPLELGAVYDYWSLYGPDLEEATGNIQAMLDETVRIDATDLEWDTKTDGDDAWVSPTRGRLTITSVEPGFVDLEVAFDVGERYFSIDGTADGSAFTFRMEWNDSTLRFSGTIEDEPFDVTITARDNTITATGEIIGEPLAVEAVIDGDCVTVTGSLGSDSLDEQTCEPGLGANMSYYTEGGSYPESALRMRKVDGKWYFSPTSTLMDGVIDVLKQLSPEDVATFENAIEDSVAQGESLAEGRFNFQEDQTGPFGLPDPNSVLEDSGLEDSVLEDSMLDEDFELDTDFTFGQDLSQSPDLDEFFSDPIFDTGTVGSRLEYGAIGTQLDGTLANDTYDEVTLTVDTAPVTLDVTSDDLDVRINLLDPTTKDVIDFNDDTGLSSNSQLVIDKPGTYLVEVRAWNPTGGDYSFMVSAGG